MRHTWRWSEFGVVVCLAFVVFLLATRASAQNKGEEYTIIVPGGSLVLEGSDWANVHKIYGLDTQARRWEVIPEALPRVFELRFEKRKKSEIEFRVPGIWIKLRFQDQADMVKRLAQYAVPSWVEEDVEGQVNAALDSAAAVAFTGTEVPRDSWRDLARYAQDLGGERLQPPESFRDGEYLAVRLGNWESVYNTRQINRVWLFWNRENRPFSQ